MKKLYLGIILVVFCIVVSNIVIAQPDKADDIVLTLTFGEEQKNYTLDDLLAFDNITGNGGRIKQTGKIEGPYEYTGVLITTLAEEFTNMSSQYSLEAIAIDNYTMNYTFEQIKGNVMVYDTHGNETGIGNVTMILATMENGQTGYDGSLRIAFINDDEPITKSYLCAKYVVELVFIPNAAPNKPDKPSGPPSGKVGEEYNYTSSATDPNGDQVMYLFDWGDGSDSGWLGPYNSSENASGKHIWNKKGTYQIKVKAKDIYEKESIWSDSLSVKIPKNRAITKPLLKLIEQHTVLYRLLQRFLRI